MRVGCRSIRTLSWVIFLGIHCVGSAAHATGMSADATLASDGPLVVASAAPVAGGGSEANSHEILPAVGFGAARATLGGWSPVGGELLPFEANEFGAASETAAGASPVPACSDSFDNDGDGRIDFPDDPGCLTPGSVTEQPRCQDGLDTDGDGAIDFDGGASLNGGVPLAPPDPQCEGAPWRFVERP